MAHDDVAHDAEPTSAPPRKKATEKKGRWRRRLAIAGISLPVLGLGMWLAVHHIPGFGPLVADTLRALFGNAFVAWLEDTAYGVEDWLNRKTKAEEPPEAFWEVPDSAAIAPTANPSASAAEAPAEPPFELAKVGPMHDNLATEGDGVWLPLVEPRHPDDRVRMLKTFLHPDKQRSWAIVAIIAFDLKHVRLHPVAGRFEPESKTPEAKDYQRTAVIPKEHHEALLAAFNGGYKSTHGDYGMRIDGVTLLPPRPLACTIGETPDGSILIHDWALMKERELRWLRQTPICMYDSGKPHAALDMPKMSWGASSVSGTTVIRRSAMGISEDGKVLFFGLGNHLTGAAIGHAMHHAGAHSVAQLDVNFSFPKFLLYEKDGDTLKPVPLTKDFEYEEDQYIGTRSHRDFFYVTRREMTAD